MTWEQYENGDADQLEAEYNGWADFMSETCDNCGGPEGRMDGFCEECRPFDDDDEDDISYVENIWGISE
jgi:hypothetical protein